MLVAASRRGAALHGGRVEAKSELGRGGSTFTLRLPAIAKGRASPSKAPLPPVAPSKKKRVLVVDDNADSAEMMVMLAESWGHEAFRAGDGRAAVTMALEIAPDVAAPIQRC